ncbi:MAG TPA: phosphatase PAP2 family protein [Blastocatellia bacterium]|nr:phosphatase PAP2 family protein [Blastocatellia bacterium]
MLELKREIIKDATLTKPRNAWAETIIALFKQLNLIDRFTLGYIAFTSVLLVFSPHHVPGRARMLIIHVLLFAFIITIAQYRRPQPSGWWQKTLRTLSHWYPILLPAYLFEEIHSLVHVVFPNWFDAAIINFDYVMFGAHPTVWFEQHISYWLTELMNFAYFAYWPLLPATALLLWFGERKHEHRTQFEWFTLSLCIAYYLCYVVFILYPIEGPYHTLRHLQQTHEMPGWIFTAAVELVEKHGRIHGGAFPSAHVAGSVVALIAAFRWSKKLGWALTPLIIGVLVSTVYGRYHYAADIWGGVLMGAVGCWAANILLRRKGSIKIDSREVL